jgi:hypothetical protein
MAHAHRSPLLPDDVKLALAEPLSPWVVLSRSRAQVALLRREAVSNLPPFAAPHVVIAGFRFHAHSHAPFAWPMLSGLRITDLREGKTRSVRVPRNGWLWPVGFSHDDEWFVFASLQPRRLRLYRVERGHTTSHQIGDFDVNAAMVALWRPPTVSPIGVWLGNSHKLACKAVVHTRSERKRVARREPLIYDTACGETAQDWIPGALDTEDDISLFRRICTSRIVIVDITSGKMSSVGTPGIFGLIEPSPDGSHLHVERVGTSNRRGTWLSALKSNWESWDLHSGRHIPIKAPRTPSHSAHDRGSRRRWEPITEVWCEEPLQYWPAPHVSRSGSISGPDIAKGAEKLVAVIDRAEPSYLVRLESRHSQPIFVIRAGNRSTPLDDRGRTGRQRARAFHKARDIVLSYRDANGASLEALAHVPDNWSRKKPLPCLIWLYPDIAESRRPSTRATRDAARNRYVRPIRFSPLVMLSRGFAVIVHPPMPVKYSRSAKDIVDEMVSVTRALCKAAVSEGVADRGKLVIGGHCRGAFAAALVLSRTARTTLFRAGALCGGLFNQLLLPLGGIDPRPTWRAPDAHVTLSPVLQVHRIKAPVLIMHGMEDVLFSGFHAVDFTIQSQQFYSAVAASGGTARYVAFPNEGHVFLGRSSVFRASEELVRWCELHTR